MDKRVHVLYSGQVQGVGFRFTAERIALDLKLTGWVKNLTDGRVEVALEGEEERINVFLKNIRDVMRVHIQKEEVLWEPPSGKFKTFEIRFR
ncbi:MAG: acylphosphatase [Candidatus Omnitrophica bacterium]|nr:acylphosphatase [Candidatus Omnitrophota bacterium]